MSVFRFLVRVSFCGWWSDEEREPEDTLENW